MLYYYLRDHDVLLTLVRVANIHKLALEEKHSLVIVSNISGHSSQYDITNGVHTLSYLLQTISDKQFLITFNGWKVIGRIPLTICLNKRTVSFLPEGIIEVFSQGIGTTVLHATDPEVLSQLRNRISIKGV